MYSSITTIRLETLEQRLLPSFGPSTVLHFAYGNTDSPNALGFNLIDVSKPNQLSSIPSGDMALIWLGQLNGVDSNFLNAIQPYLHNPQVFGFYLADEPNPTTVPPANLLAESDWIHDNDPGAKTFIVLGALPIFSPYTPSSTHVDLVGIDPYPSRSYGFFPEYIAWAWVAARLDGWSNSQIVPIYQAFGDSISFTVPNIVEEYLSFLIWQELVPNPTFDATFSWTNIAGGVALDNLPQLQSLFLIHNTY